MLRYKQFANQAGWLLTALLLLSLTLAACGGAPTVEAPAEVAESQPEPTQPVEAPAEENEPATEESQVEPPATPTEVDDDEEAPAPVAASVAECQSIDIPDNALIAAVTDTDWANGPADAPVTLIEYGDYQ
jgi:outer membrane biosynthesis protein TonB